MLGEYLLRLVEVLDRPLSWLISSVERLFERIKDLFTDSFPTSPHWPDTEPDDWESHAPPPSPRRQNLPLPAARHQLATYAGLPPTAASLPHKLSDASQQAALDLSVRHSSHVQAADGRYRIPKPHASGTLAGNGRDDFRRTAPATHNGNAHAAARLGWNPQRPQVSAPLAGSSRYNVQASATRAASSTPCLWTADVPRTTAAHAQSRSVAYGLQPTVTLSSLSSRLSSSSSTVAGRRREFDGSFETLCSEACSAGDSYRSPQNHQLLHTSSHHHHQQQQQQQQLQCLGSGGHFAPLSREQPPSYDGPAAPVRCEQPSPPAVAPPSPEQRSSAGPSVAPVASESVGRLCVLRCLAVVDEFVGAVQLAADNVLVNSCRARADDTGLAIGWLSDVLQSMASLHRSWSSGQPSGQCGGQWRPVVTQRGAVDGLAPAMRSLELTLKAVSCTQQQQQQQQGKADDVAEFLASLLRLLRPHLTSTDHGQPLTHSTIMSMSIKYLYSANNRRSNLRRWRVGD